MGDRPVQTHCHVVRELHRPGENVAQGQEIPDECRVKGKYGSSPRLSLVVASRSDADSETHYTETRNGWKEASQATSPEPIKALDHPLSHFEGGDSSN